jgi:hypothetical protein
MNNHSHRSLGAWLRLVVFSVMVFAPFSMAQAASVAIDTLSVSAASLSIHITNDGTYNFSGPVVPPVTLIMGTYQNPIVSGTNWKIYSTSLFGKPAPTGTVDGALNTINVDFSSLRAQALVTGYGMIDVALWPLINPPTSGSYNGTTGAYTLNWSSAFSVNLTGFPTPVTGTATVTLSGVATPVPLPAAVWLLGSGLLGLVGVVRLKRQI